MPSITVGKGKKNPKAEILKLQKALNAVRFKCGAEDGLWGPKTQDALERFQKVYLPYEVDRIFGPNTRKKLHRSEIKRILRRG
ncbi:peptidoglycan-binding domain-containing protein [Fictibacillus enclensis]|uniref:peptidoglycan-binding domain-containing protein n=1 Tax=Fictibacillus enclensis TaxID=1017270 RepID=UPI0033382DE2